MTGGPGTGKAAQQLGEDARTIHSLLGYGPKGFDEASMINWRTLYAALKAADRIIFAGDSKQLPPIEGGCDKQLVFITSNTN